MIIKDSYLHDLVNQTNFDNIYYNDDTYHEPWVSYHAGLTNVTVSADPTGIVLNSLNTTPKQTKIRVICDNLDDSLFIFLETQSSNFILDKTTIFNIASHIEEEIKIIYFPNNKEEEINNTIILRTKNFPDIRVNITGTNEFDDTPYLSINPKTIIFSQSSSSSSNPYEEVRYITLTSRSLSANVLVTLNNEWTENARNNYRYLTDGREYSSDHHIFYGLVNYNNFDYTDENIPEPLSLEINKDNANNYKIPVSVFPNGYYYENNYSTNGVYYCTRYDYIKSTIIIHSMNEETPDFEDIKINILFDFYYTGPSY